MPLTPLHVVEVPFSADDIRLVVYTPSEVHGQHSFQEIVCICKNREQADKYLRLFGDEENHERWRSEILPKFQKSGVVDWDEVCDHLDSLPG